MQAISQWYRTVCIPRVVASYDTHKGKRWRNSNPKHHRGWFFNNARCSAYYLFAGRISKHYHQCCMVGSANITKSVAWSDQQTLPPVLHGWMSKYYHQCAVVGWANITTSAPWLDEQTLPTVLHGWMSKHFSIIIIKKGQQCKAGKEWYTPYQSEDLSPTIPTYRQKKEKGKESRRL